ncbi:MAG: GxxExxY protein [Acidobacteria bacterium]|nr:GxxExxY protein [Acidobacteriota bacterium]
MSANGVSRVIVDAAMKVHSALGPGLLESAYKACLKHEIEKRGLSVRTEVPLPVIYEDVKLELGYRLDLLVSELVIVEVKAIEALAPIHQAQIISYLKLSGKSLGLLINFHVAHLKNGIRRFVLGTDWE